MQPIERPTLEQMMKRKANLERKRKQRAREKARTSQAIHDYLEKITRDRVNAEGLARHAKLNRCTLGEITPGVDATTIDEALAISREFARALCVPDVQEGESLFDFERRVFNAWTNYEGFRGGNNSCDGGGASYLNRQTGQLSPGRGQIYWQEYCGGFDECWQALPGARKRIDLATLSKLKKIKKPEESKPEAKAAPTPAVPAPIPQQQPDAVNFAWIPPNAQRYLNGG